MKHLLSLLALAAILLTSCTPKTEQAPYLFNQNSTTAWASFENPKALKGEGAKTNKGAKGFPSKWIQSGEQVTLMEDDGCGIVRRIWITISNRSAEMLRAIRLEMYWDGATTPAVSVPLGDFFCASTGIKKPFQSALIEDPEGRSFVSYIQMPYRKGAKITFTNTANEGVTLFYDINFTREKKIPKEAMYFHACFRHDPATTLGVDHTVLTEVKGRGRFLGMSVGVIADTTYNWNWWGEGEVKMYIDGDTSFPSLVGTGTEDYIGTAWGQGAFSTPYQGCIVAGEENCWSFYRFHIPDPIYFNSSIRVTLQQIGGTFIDDLKNTLAKGARLIPISIEDPETHQLHYLLEADISNPNAIPFTKGWVNYYRSDNVASTAYFYHEKPAL